MIAKITRKGGAPRFCRGSLKVRCLEKDDNPQHFRFKTKL